MWNHHIFSVSSKFKFKTPRCEPNECICRPDWLECHPFAASRFFVYCQCLAHHRRSINACWLKRKWANEWMNRKEGADGWERGNRMDAQESRCQVAGRAVQGDPSAKLSVWTSWWSCWLTGVEGQGWETRSLWTQSQHPALRRHYAKTLSLQAKTQTQQTNWCAHTHLYEVCKSGGSGMPQIPHSQRRPPSAKGRKKRWSCNLRGARRKEKSHPARILSLARNSFSAACGLHWSLGWGWPWVSLAWTLSLQELYQEGVVYKLPGWNAWGCKRKVISGSTEL